MKEPLRNARFLMAETAHERLPLSESEVAFVGRSNVGKSSLLCALTDNWKLARVSKTPGATRAINVFEVRQGRWLIDLPGYGFAVGPERARNYWPEMISKYLTERSMMKRVYVLIDAEIGATDVDASVVSWMRERSVPFRIVGTKTDRIGRQKHAAHKDKIASALGVPASEVEWVTAKEGYGLTSLRQDVLRHLGI